MNTNFSVFKNLNSRENLNSGNKDTSGITGTEKPGIESVFSPSQALNKNLADDKNALKFQGIFEYNPKTNSPVNTNPASIRNPFEKTCTIENVAKSMIKIIDAKNNYTARHSRAVQKYAGNFAEKLGLSKHESEAISLGSMFHDIGKIGITDSILKSELPLSTKEFEEIKTHPVIGYGILEDIPEFNGAVTKIIRHHHEHWDGTGYPDQLCGENIPFEARIVAIVDAYHAMTSDRPYRKGLSRNEAAKRLREGARKQWDPALITEFIKIFF